MEGIILILVVVLAVFLLTVFFGAPYVPSHRADLIKLFRELNWPKKRCFGRYWLGRWCCFEGGK
ncbi:MAG: hypothetical protein Q4A27_02905 [bacterium]|nr:hypothetical protein [bacterium]